MPYTTDDLVSAVRLRARLSTASDITAADILELATEELQTNIADVMRTADPSFWLVTKDFTVTSANVYRIPHRAHLGGIESASLIDGTTHVPLHPVSVHDAVHYETNAGSHWHANVGYTLEADRIRLLPSSSPVLGQTLRIKYQRQPPTLVPVSQCNTVIGASTLQINCGEAHVSLIADETHLLDVVMGDGTYQAVASDLLISGLSGTDIDLNPSTPMDLSVYTASTLLSRVDYVTAAGTSPYVPAPRDVWPLLVATTTRSVCEILGDTRGVQVATQTANARKDKIQRMAKPRNRQSPPLVNQYSRLRWGGRG